VNDPSTETWRATFAAREVTNSWDTASTSAQLRETQAALAASQADLTAMQADRDALAVLNAELKDEAAEMRRQAQNWLAKLEETARALATANHRNRVLAAENEAALRRLNELREVL